MAPSFHFQATIFSSFLKGKMKTALKAPNRQCGPKTQKNSTHELKHMLLKGAKRIRGKKQKKNDSKIPP